MVTHAHLEKCHYAWTMPISQTEQFVGAHKSREPFFGRRKRIALKKEWCPESMIYRCFSKQSFAFLILPNCQLQLIFHYGSITIKAIKGKVKAQHHHLSVIQNF